MGEAGRKLTIRMPDNPRLRTAEVCKIHLDPGASVRVGSPIMTLSARRREHMVRAPRSGRVVPLVSNGDEVQCGDPLYVLNIDEHALAAANRESRELVAVEKAKWAAGLTPDVIEPMMRHREARAESRSASSILSVWAKPALAVALYILACFALLPILNAFGHDASPMVLAGMCIGSLLFAAVIYHLYAPDSGVWPRWTVRLVAISWVGISAMAIFYRPASIDDITLADAATEAASPIASLFAGQNVVLDVTPAPVSAPVLALASGVTAGPGEVLPRPDWTAPVSTLGAPGASPVAHGVWVREWARANPTNASGDPLVASDTDLAVALPTATAVAVSDQRADPVAPDVSGSIVAASSEAPDLTVMLADAAAEAKAEAEAAVLAAKAHPVLPVLTPPVLAKDPDAIAMAGLSPALLVGAQALSTAGDPGAEDAAERADTVSTGLASLPDVSRAGTWADRGEIPVVRGAAALPSTDDVVIGPDQRQAPEPIVAAWALAPARPDGGSTPELLLIAQQNSTVDVWMADQVAMAKTDRGPTIASPSADRADAQRVVGVLAEPLALVQAAASRNASATGPSSIAVLNGMPAPPLTAASEPLRIATAAAPPAMSRGTPSMTDIGPLPGLAPAAPPWQSAPAPEFAERVLVFLFYDDPRLTTLPAVGDDWTAQVSPDLAASIDSSKVEAIGEIIEVINWCAAANDPGGKKEKFLPGGAYRTAALSDRIRLLQVRLSVDPGKLSLLEQELPVFGEAPVDFMGPRVPLLGGTPQDKVMDRVAAHLGERSNHDADPNTPPKIQGGKYYASAEGLAEAMQAAGCKDAIWNLGDGPANKIGRRLAEKFAG